MSTSLEGAFEGNYPFEPHFLKLPCGRIHYVDEGEGEPIVFVHGNPTWSFLWRHFIGPCSQTHRVVAPDHLGFGRSDKPTVDSYHSDILSWHIQNFRDLLNHLNLKNITLVVHDWGGPIGLGFATTRPEAIRRLVVMNTWCFQIPKNTPLTPLLEVLRKPGIGERLALEDNYLVEKGIPAGIYHKKRITNLMMEAYRSPFKQMESRQAALSLTRAIPIGNEGPVARVIKTIQDKLRLLKDIPVCVIWGTKDPVFPSSLVAMWRFYFPHIEIHEIPEASHFLQEDEPERILALIQGFISSSRSIPVLPPKTGK